MCVCDCTADITAFWIFDVGKVWDVDTGHGDLIDVRSKAEMSEKFQESFVSNKFNDFRL